MGKAFGGSTNICTGHTRKEKLQREGTPDKGNASLLHKQLVADYNITGARVQSDYKTRLSPALGSAIAPRGNDGHCCSAQGRQDLAWYVSSGTGGGLTAMETVVGFHGEYCTAKWTAMLKLRE